MGKHPTLTLGGPRWAMSLFLLLAFSSAFAVIADEPPGMEGGDISVPPACSSDLLYETFEQGSGGWTHEAFFLVQEDSWHLDWLSCRGDELGSMMFVANGNCFPVSWGVDRSKLFSPAVDLPASGPWHLTFDAVSFDEGGRCLHSTDFDLKDAGISLDGGATWIVLNDCWELTPYSVDWRVTAHHQFNISAFGGQSVRVLFAYDTVDADVGHTFGVDNVRIIHEDFDEDGVGAACDCLPNDGSAWDVPGEVTDLSLSHSPPGELGTTTLSWNAPATGGVPEAMVYDVIRSPDPSNFTDEAICVQSDAGPGTTADDSDLLFAGEVFFYRVRARNACGEGIAGRDSNDLPQPARPCP